MRFFFICLIFFLQTYAVLSQAYLLLTKDTIPKYVLPGDTVNIAPLSLYLKSSSSKVEDLRRICWIFDGKTMFLDVPQKPIWFIGGQNSGLPMSILPCLLYRIDLMERDSSSWIGKELSKLNEWFQFYDRRGIQSTEFVLEDNKDTISLALDFMKTGVDHSFWQKSLARFIEKKEKRAILKDSLVKAEDQLLISLDSAQKVITVCRSLERIHDTIDRRYKNTALKIDSMVRADLNQFDLPSRVAFYELYYLDVNSGWRQDNLLRMEIKGKFHNLKRMNEWLHIYEQWVKKQQEYRLQINGLKQQMDVYQCKKVHSMEKLVLEIETIKRRLEQI